jgi:hypothetical protein
VKGLKLNLPDNRYRFSLSSFFPIDPPGHRRSLLKHLNGRRGLEISTSKRQNETGFPGNVLDIIHIQTWNVNRSYRRPSTGIMKSLYLFLAAVLLLPGCSKPSADIPPNDGNVHNVSTNGLPWAVTVVETDPVKQWSALAKLSLIYLQKSDYDALEKLAEDGRSAEDAWPDGNWPVVPVYLGLEMSANPDDGAWLARQKAIEAWIQARPESITARVALARHLVDFAWKARGRGYADTVSDEADRLFKERLRQAAGVLKAAADLKAKCPVYWTTVMKAALGLGVPQDQHRRIFQAAVQAYPDFTPIYVQRAIFLLPRWYGGDGEWVTDLAQSADQLGGKKGDILYAQVAWLLKDFSSWNNIFEETTNLSWERVDRGFSALEKKFPDSLEAIQMHGHLASLAGDGKTARKCLLQTEGKVTLWAWGSKGEFIDFANWALAQ